MKSPIPLLAIGAALLLMGKKKKSSDKGNFLQITADSALPIPKGPYIQVISTYPEVGLPELTPVVKPIADANKDIEFVIAGPEGADRLHFSQYDVEMTTPDVFEVKILHADSEKAVIKGMGGDDVTLTDLQNIVMEAVEYIRAPYSEN